MRLSEEGDSKAAVAAYDDFDACYRHNTSPRIREMLANALFNRALILKALNRQSEDAHDSVRSSSTTT
ncbi:MAG TPA: hypothetical protein VFC19_14135 [Candidatus Limnocylindrales bacterium]|nr:hypothetical protein [Candidatus Limnocylindrales bacterium]